MGVPGGPFDTATGDVDGWPTFNSNPHGQFEDNDFVRLFDYAHGAWGMPHWWKVSATAEAAAADLIGEREAAHTLWGLKTPQLCYTLPYMLEYFSDPVIIATHRDFDDMVDSLQRRDLLPRPVCEQIQARYFLLRQSMAEYAAQRGVPILDLEFADILKIPTYTTGEIVDFVGMEPTLQEEEKAAASIQPHAHA